MVEKETTYTPDELRAQIDRMWLRKYPDGPTDEKWLLQVGIGAGMLDVAADQIEELQSDHDAAIEALRHMIGYAEVLLPVLGPVDKEAILYARQIAYPTAKDEHGA